MYGTFLLISIIILLGYGNGKIKKGSTEHGDQKLAILILQRLD